MDKYLEIKKIFVLFRCDYDRERMDGNPKRKKYKIDTRLNLKNNFMFKVNLRQ